MSQSGKKGSSGRLLDGAQGQIYFDLTRRLQDLHKATSSTILAYIKNKIFRSYVVARRWLVRHGRFGTAYLPHLQGSRWPAKNEA